MVNRDEPGTFVVTISVLNVTTEDGGEYFCHAENSQGATTTALAVQVCIDISICLFTGCPKKSVIIVLMAISAIKSVRNEKNWGV